MANLRRGVAGCRDLVRRLTWSLLLFLLFFGAAGCVKTAQCDEYVGCPEGKACYQHRCLWLCEDDEQCAEGEVCRVCRAEGEDERLLCPEGAVKVCMESEEQGF